jgi:NAD(P)H-dependent FMN reductase
MKKILVFGASDSSQSINKKLAVYTGSQLSDVEITVIDLRDFDMPLFGVDRKAAIGIPAAAKRFIDIIAEHDGIIVSFAEYNSGYSTAFKNVQDWASTIRKDIFQQKPTFILSTSPGSRGGANVLSFARQFLPFMGAQIISAFSLPFFKENFSGEAGITDGELKNKFQRELDRFAQAVKALQAILN